MILPRKINQIELLGIILFNRRLYSKLRNELGS